MLTVNMCFDKVKKMKYVVVTAVLKIPFFIPGPDNFTLSCWQGEYGLYVRRFVRTGISRKARNIKPFSCKIKSQKIIQITAMRNKGGLMMRLFPAIHIIVISLTICEMVMRTAK